MTQSNVPAKRADALDLAMFPANTDAGDYNKISPAQARALITWSERYGLDPWAGHTCYMYGKPYVTERGAIYNAQSSHRCRGYATVRKNADDLINLGYEDAVAGWECTVFVVDQEQGIKEYGVVTRMEQDQLRAKTLKNLLRNPDFAKLTEDERERTLLEKLSYLPLFREPSTMARVRAVRRAHLAAFGLISHAETITQLSADEEKGGK